MSEFVQLKSENDWIESWQLLKFLKPSLDQSELLNNRTQLTIDGYKLFGLQENQKLIVVAAAILVPHIIDKSNFWILDMVTLPEYRSQGYGSEMLNYLEIFAMENQCKRVIVHSRLGRDKAHSFYQQKADFEDYAYLFSKKIG